MKTKVDGKEIQNNSWYNPHEIEGEINEEPSQTVPNQDMSVSEILKKSIQGILPPIIKTPQYDEIDDIDQPVLSRMIDVTEVEETLVTKKAKIERAKKAAQKEEEIPQNPEGSNPEEAQIPT